MARGRARSRSPGIAFSPPRRPPPSPGGSILRTGRRAGTASSAPLPRSSSRTPPARSRSRAPREERLRHRVILTRSAPARAETGPRRGLEARPSVQAHVPRKRIRVPPASPASRCALRREDYAQRLAEHRVLAEGSRSPSLVEGRGRSRVQVEEVVGEDQVAGRNSGRWRRAPSRRRSVTPQGLRGVDVGAVVHVRRGLLTPSRRAARGRRESRKPAFSQRWTGLEKPYGVRTPRK